MSDPQQKVKDNFEENFKATEYFGEMANFWGSMPELFRFMIMFIHDVFSSGKFKGSKLLELGSAATVHSVASASKYFDTIVLSDYVQDNIRELKLWLKGDSSVEQFLDLQAGLEGYGNDLPRGRSIIESRIREKVKLVTSCDILTENILLEENGDPETSPPFDAIISCFCLDVACADVDRFAYSVRGIGRLLKPGGGLLMTGHFQGDPWQVEGKEFHQLKQLTQENMVEALKRANFCKIEIKTIAAEEKPGAYYKHDKMFCMTAEQMRK